MIESLFTPEVMERMFAVLETAAQGSVAVLIVYLLIPLLISLSVTVGWCYAVYHIVKRVHDVLIAHFARPRPEVVKKEVINRIKLDGKDFLMTDLAKKELADLLDDIRQKTGAGRTLGFKDISDAKDFLKTNWGGR